MGTVHQAPLRMLLLLLLPLFGGDAVVGQLEEEGNSTYYSPPGQCLYRAGRPGFVCEDGGCIERGEVCNGRSLSRGQCEDGSDEEVDCCVEQCITETAVAVCIPDDGYNHTESGCRECTKGGYPDSGATTVHAYMVGNGVTGGNIVL